MIEHAPVTSSNLVSAGYDAATKTMEIGFKAKGGTALYRYADVPQDVYDRFMVADSKGKFVHEHIKGKFSHSKV